MVNIFKSLGFLALMFVAVTSVSASQSGTVSSGWLSPAIGGITGHSGYVWVWGVEVWEMHKAGSPTITG